MTWQWLGYPQVVLALWCPLLVVGLHRALRPALRRLPPREQFFVATTAALVPGLALLVPYVPSLGLREALPWRAPIAWGISTMDVPAATPTGVPAALLAASVVPTAGLVLSVAWGLAEAAVSRIRVGRMVVERRGDLRVVESPEMLAFTAGLLRPRVVLSRPLLEAPEAPVVVSHERAHARGHHPAWIMAATCTLRAWWWIPGRAALLAELRTSAELWADADARWSHGRQAVAEALASRIGIVAPPVGNQAAAFGGLQASLVRRAEALGAPTPALALSAGMAVRGLVLALAAVVVVLL